ncbi:hypothetical protein GP475_00845 [Corynebacterium poyangense]|uniref:Secreted protein n=1 Tax=Corynebacterium poyangense TaxID=2684405 RepID=A0A7H0SLB6_9CORY|nr:hypothetical protein [Corynebacterium poyangense]QNQ89341.1 hypothetical protein GP475_00845 [Corynebacterium poyangense]
MIPKNQCAPAARPQPRAIQLALLALFTAAVLPFVLAAVVRVAGASPARHPVPLDLGNDEWTVSVPTSVSCLSKDSSQPDVRTWECGSTNVTSSVAENPENSDRTLRRALRAATNRNVSEPSVSEVYSSGNVSLLAPSQSGAVAMQLKVEASGESEVNRSETENPAKVLNVVLYKTGNPEEMKTLAGAIWQALSGAAPDESVNDVINQAFS